MKSLATRLLQACLFTILFVFNSFAVTWTERAALPIVTWNPSVVEAEGLIYVLGGMSDVSPYAARAAVQVYNTAEDSWTTTTRMPTPRWGMMVGEWNGKIYVCGGFKGNFFGYTATDHVEVYDIATATWDTLSTSLPTARGWGGSVVFGDTLFVFGGYDSQLTTSFTLVEKCDLVSEAWSTDPSMPDARDTFVTVLVDGKAYLVGGSNSVGQTEDANQCFDLTAKTWTDLEPLPNAKLYTSGTAINGCVVIGGGRGEGAGTDCQVYDPVTDSWTLSDPMPIAREGSCMATVDNRVFIMAGSVVYPPGLPYIDTTVEGAELVGVSEPQHGSLPRRFSLSQNYPNPFNGATRIEFSLPETADLTLTVFNRSGRVVTQLARGVFEAGNHRFAWNAEGIASGVYFIQLRGTEFSQTRRCILLR